MGKCWKCKGSHFGQGRCDDCHTLLQMDHQCGSCISWYNGICNNIQEEYCDKPTQIDFGCSSYRYAAD